MQQIPSPPGAPAPLADGRHVPNKRVQTLAYVGLGLAAFFAVVLVLNLGYEQELVTRIIGLSILSLLILFFGWLGLNLLRGLRGATLVVDASGVHFPRLAAIERTRVDERFPWVDLGPTYVLYAENQKPAAMRASTVGRMLPGATYSSVICTDRDGRVLASLNMPVWPQETVLGLAARIHAQTGRPPTLTRVESLPAPGSLGATFLPDDARRLSLD